MRKLIKVLLVKNSLLFLGILYSSLITIAFLKPVSDLPKFSFIINDKIAHLTIYIVLSFIWLIYFFILKNSSITIKNVIWIFIGCMFYGIIIEVLQQLLLTTRQAEINDVLANMLGSFIGAFLFWNVKNRIKT